MKALTLTLLCLFLVNMAFAKSACPTDERDLANLVVDQGTQFLLGKAPTSCFKSLLDSWRKEQPYVSDNELVQQHQDSSMKAISTAFGNPDEK